MWNFKERLGQSQRADITTRLDRYYLARFQCVRVERRDDDLSFQRAGNDLVLHFADGTDQTVEEKIRFRTRPDGTDYPDVLLETISNDVTQTPGWAIKPFAADWLCYYRVHSDITLLFPGDAVRAAVRLHIEEWKQRYREKPAQNVGYRTWNVAVPDSVFLAAVDEAKGTGACPSCGTLIAWSETRFNEATGWEGCATCDQR